MRGVAVLPAMFVLACAARPSSPRSPVETPLSTLKAASARLLIASDPAREGYIRSELRLVDTHETTFSFRPSHPVEVASVAFRDDAGVLLPGVREDGPARHYTLPRRSVGTLAIDTTVSFSTTDEGDGPWSEPIELRAGCEDVLILPDGDGERRPMTLSLRTAAVPAGAGAGTDASTTAASSFGLGLTQRFSARWSELRFAHVLVGDVGSASFHTSSGDDVAAWLGHTAFDPRWVAAEIAGVRSATDTYFGRAPAQGEPPVTTMIVPTKRVDPPVIVSVRTRGLVIAPDRRAAWGSTPRLLVAQALVQRYVGGALRVEVDRERGEFFRLGFPRAIGREILAEGGLLDVHEQAGELNALLAATVFGDDPVALATARGALFATALDAALRTRPEGSLRGFVRAWLRDVAARDATLNAFVARIHRAGLDAVATHAAEYLSGARPVPLPADLLGRCYRLADADLVPFELGFRVSADDPMTVLVVRPDSNAARAGMLVGDAVEDLRYVAGRASTPVRLVRIREGTRQPVTFLPRGKGKRGRVYERIAGVRDDAC